MATEELTDEAEDRKAAYEEAVGYWVDEFDAWLQIDPDSFEAYADFAAYPHETGHISKKNKALIKLAITASPTHMYTQGTRFHIQNCFDKGASVEEIKETLELVSILGLHSIIDGMPSIIDAMGLPEDGNEEEKEQVRIRFEEKRGYWNEFWDSILDLDHGFLERYTYLSGYPWDNGVLDPKMKEFVYIAIDVSTTHLYTLGMDQHLENAMEYGATREEIAELIELVSEQGYDAMIEAMPILLEEAEKRGKL